jgi:hypothetical protein
MNMIGLATLRYRLLFHINEHIKFLFDLDETKRYILRVSINPYLMKNYSSKLIKSAIIYIAVIAGTIFVILITLMFQLMSELTPAQSIPSITSVAVTGFIGVFTYYYQSKGERRRIQVVQEISKIVKERINIALVRGQLIVIGKEIGYLSDILRQYLR